MTFIDGMFVNRECIDLHSASSYMRSIATNAAAAPTAAKAPLFWLCTMGAAAEVPVLSAGAEAVVVPVPKLVAVPMLLGIVGDSPAEAEGVDAAVARGVPVVQRREVGNATPTELQICRATFAAVVRSASLQALVTQQIMPWKTVCEEHMHLKSVGLQEDWS